MIVGASGADVVLNDVCHSFGATQVLHDLDCKFSPGEFVAIVGRSGSGKSTLLRLVAGLELQSQGTIKIDDDPVRDVVPSMRMMFQEGRLLPWLNVFKNITLGLPRSQWYRARNLLTRVGLANRANDWPAKLSGGQRQRVALARALAADPQLLLLDEPLGSLDTLTRLEMQQLIEQMWQERGFTAVLITHDVEEAVALADRVLILEHGKMTGEWTIPLSRPRRRTDIEFVSLADQILQRVLKE